MTRRHPPTVWRSHRDAWLALVSFSFTLLWACAASPHVDAPRSDAVEEARAALATAESRARDVRPPAPPLGPVPAPEVDEPIGASGQNNDPRPAPPLRRPDGSWWGLPFTFVAWPPAVAPHDPGRTRAAEVTFLSDPAFRLPCSLVLRIHGESTSTVAGIAVRTSVEGRPDDAMREFRLFGHPDPDFDLKEETWATFIESAAYLGGTRPRADDAWGLYVLETPIEVSFLWLQILRSASDTRCSLGGIRVLAPEDLEAARQLPLTFEERVRLSEVDIEPWRGQGTMGFPTGQSPVPISDEEVERRLREGP